MHAYYPLFPPHMQASKMHEYELIMAYKRKQKAREQQEREGGGKTSDEGEGSGDGEGKGDHTEGNRGDHGADLEGFKGGGIENGIHRKFVIRNTPRTKRRLKVRRNHSVLPLQP